MYIFPRANMYGFFPVLSNKNMFKPSTLAMVTYSNLYSTKLADLSAPLRDPTKHKKAFKLGQTHTLKI